MASAVEFGDTFWASSGDLASLTRYVPGSVAHRHRHEDAYVSVVLGGGFCQTTRSDRFSSSGDLIVLPAGCWHSDKVGPSGSTCLNLHLIHDQAEALEGISGKLGHHACAIAREIANELMRDANVDSFALEALIHEFISDVRTGGTATADHAAVDLLVDWIASEPLRRWSLSDTAHLVGLHPTHLARAFRQRTGQSIGAFRRAHLIIQLCLTIPSTDRSLAEIAFEFGFADQPHMTRFFTRQMGLSPGKYRQAHR